MILTVDSIYVLKDVHQRRRMGTIWCDIWSIHIILIINKIVKFDCSLEPTEPFQMCILQTAADTQKCNCTVSRTTTFSFCNLTETSDATYVFTLLAVNL